MLRGCHRPGRTSRQTLTAGGATRPPPPPVPRPRRRSPAAVGDAEAAGAVLEVAGGAVGQQHAALLGGGLPCTGTQAGERFSLDPPAARPARGRAVPEASSSARARV